MTTKTSEIKTIEALMNEPYFSIKRDNQIIKAGGFWCEACLSGKPSSEQSTDTRYCQECYEVLTEEAKILPSNKRPSWIPKETQSKRSETQQNKKIIVSKPKPIESLQPKQKEVLVHSKSSTTQAYQNHTEERPKPNVGGRPRKEVPTELVYRLSDKGLSIGGIVKKLKTQGIELSAMTIQRLLSGERKHIVI